MADRVTRKDFIAIAGAAGAAGALPPGSVEAAETHAAAHAKATHAGGHKAKAPALGTQPEAYIYFTLPERAFVEAAVDRLIPTDALGPGAKPAGVAYFIDQQLMGEFGYGAKMYMAGPWPAALPTQGYQLRLNPREVYRLGIAEANAYAQKTYHKTFDQLSGTLQDTMLTAMEHGTIAFTQVPAKTFFEMLYMNTLEGFWADPMYGGNRDKVGWKLVGFPGVAAAYITTVTQYNKPYNVPPVGITDVGKQAADETEHQLLHTMAQSMKARR